MGRKAGYLPRTNHCLSHLPLDTHLSTPFLGQILFSEGTGALSSEDLALGGGRFPSLGDTELDIDPPSPVGSELARWKDPSAGGSPEGRQGLCLGAGSTATVK